MEMSHYVDFLYSCKIELELAKGLEDSPQIYPLKKYIYNMYNLKRCSDVIDILKVKSFAATKLTIET